MHTCSFVDSTKFTIIALTFVSWCRKLPWLRINSCLSCIVHKYSPKWSLSPLSVVKERSVCYHNWDFHWNTNKKGNENIDYWIGTAVVYRHFGFGILHGSPYHLTTWSKYNDWLLMFSFFPPSYLLFYHKQILEYEWMEDRLLECSGRCC